jgi:uncharacterized protein (DUF433 family)
MNVVPLEYIEVDDRGVAKLIGTRAKVRQIVMDQMNGMTPEQIHEAYPHLRLAQIHAALAYYYDHKDAIDAEIEEGRRSVEEMRTKNPNRHTREELEALLKAKQTGQPHAEPAQPD